MSDPNEELQYSPELVQATLEAVKRSLQRPDALRTAMAGAPAGELMLARSTKRSVGCVSLEVQDGQVCVDLPLFFPDICIPIPLPIPDGTVVKACIYICFGGFGNLIPQGVCVTVKFLGDDLVHACIGTWS